MKTIYYTGAVTRIYRAALDQLSTAWPEGGTPELDERFMTELEMIGSRGYTENFFTDPPDREDMLYDLPHLIPTHHPVGIVVEAGSEPLIDIRNPLLPGETIEYLDKGLTSSFHKVDKLLSVSGEDISKANPGTMARLNCTPPADSWERGALLRKKT